jgi:hypothetical protein
MSAIVSSPETNGDDKGKVLIPGAVEVKEKA